jgi:hypothetical protein
MDLFFTVIHSTAQTQFKDWISEGMSLERRIPLRRLLCQLCSLKLKVLDFHDQIKDVILWCVFLVEPSCCYIIVVAWYDREALHRLPIVLQDTVETIQSIGNTYSPKMSDRLSG